MKRILIPIAACFLFLSASAQDKRTADNLSFVYDVFYQYCFDNREFARSGDLFMDSETINLARLAPSVGLSLDSGDGLIQSVMAMPGCSPAGSRSSGPSPSLRGVRAGCRPSSCRTR